MNLLTWNEELKCYTFNLPAGLSCLAASSWCRGETKSKHKCYGQCGFFRTSKVHIAQDKRWQATQDLPIFIETLTEECIQKLQRAKNKQANNIRFHSSGDIYSIDYLLALGEIARHCSEQKFMLPTRTWQIPEFKKVLHQLDREIPNLIIWFSTDPTTGVPQDKFRKNFILDEVFGNYHKTMPKPNCAKQTEKGKEKGCQSCNFTCWNKSSKDRTFKAH